MDIVKGRQKAKAQKAAAAKAAQLEAQIAAQSREGSTVDPRVDPRAVDEGAAVAGRASDSARDAELRAQIDQGRARMATRPPGPALLAQGATAHNDGRDREATLVPSRPPVRIDPLQDFLAAYDDNDDDDDDDDDDDVAPSLDDERRFLSFDLAGEAYAASIMDIREILKVVTLTEVPRAPREVLGVLSKRGVVMPVADLAAILGLRPSSRALDRDQRVLVAGDNDRVCGLRVDRVRQVVRLGQRAIEDVPPSLGNKNAHMLIGLGRARVEGQEQPRMFILLDVPAVLAHFAETMGIAPVRETPR